MEERPIREPAALNMEDAIISPRSLRFGVYWHLFP
jgi:hypothetical protein